MPIIANDTSKAITPILLHINHHLHQQCLLYVSVKYKHAENGKQRLTSGYAAMVHGRGCNPHRCTTTFANVEITSL